MSKRINKRNIFNPLHFAIIFASAFLLLGLVIAFPATVQAAPQHGFGRNPGRIQPINENDFHTNQWNRFHNNYHFTSGMNYRYDLGRPTTFDGFVPVDVFSVNLRRDANVSLRPPGYGVFSGVFSTEPSNRFFPQPVNPNFHMPIELQNPNVISHFDTLQMGANALINNAGTTWGPGNGYTTSMINHDHVRTLNGGGFLPPTSITE